MLLKYLNQLEDAVQAARERQTLEAYRQLAICVLKVERYLEGQARPIRERGEQMMMTIMPDRLRQRVEHLSTE